MSQNFETFGKYILLEKLAMGGMAEIYLARNSGASGVSKFVAIKRILPQFTEQTEFIDMFKDEAKIAVNLSHANIVSIYEFGIEKNAFFLAMDYIEGRNLRQILNKMKKSGLSFSIEQVLYIIKEVASGLDHAHRCIDANTGKPLNIIHRDMSPQNVMVSFEGEVKIVDFGIAKAETQLETTRAGTLKGKFGYMSPEQAEGQPVDLRTDVFALGIVLWELLANDRLFVANNEVNTLRKIRECQIPSLRKINPAIPPELERIVSKALAKDRNLRYQTGAAFHRELSRFLNRQYPDFSPQDFSVYIKNLFAGEILESRKKMIEYSKLDHSKLPAAAGQPDSTVVTDTQTEVESTGGNVDFGNSAHRNKKAPPPPPTPPVDPGMMKRTPDPEKVRQTFEGVAAPANLTFERNAYNGMQVREGTLAHTRSYSGVKREEPRSSFMGFLILLIFLGFAAGGGAYYYSNPQRATKVAVAALVQWGVIKPVEVVNISSTTPIVAPPAPSAVLVPIAVSSSPSGAPIEVNGVLSGETTPATLQLEKGKDVKIAIKLSGYVPSPYEETFRVDAPRAVNAQFKSDKKGFLNIFVRGEGKIYLGEPPNAQMVASASPARMIAVPADQNVTITVYDEATNTGDRMVVMVGAESTRNITLSPRALPPRQTQGQAPAPQPQRPPSRDKR